MSNTLHFPGKNVISSSASADGKMMSELYDEHAAVLLGFLEKMSNDKGKAEELLESVFLAVPAQLHKYDVENGRFVVWLLKLARTIARSSPETPDFNTNTKNRTTNSPIHGGSSNVHAPVIDTESGNDYSLPLMVGKEKSVVELLYVKGYNFTEAAAELGVEESTVRSLVRIELKKYRRS